MEDWLDGGVGATGAADLAADDEVGVARLQGPVVLRAALKGDGHAGAEDHVALLHQATVQRGPGHGQPARLPLCPAACQHAPNHRAVTQNLICLP